MKRRSFIEKTAIGSAAMITAFPYPAMAKDKKLKMGLIGCGWYGMVDATTALKVGGVEFIAMCDIDTEHLKSSTDKIEELQGKRPKEYKDYRELLDNKKLDAVIIATPPHWHALQFIAACEQDLDVYCEKPLAYDIDESKAMVNAARKAGNIVQIGFQRRQSQAFQKAKELIGDGTTGKIHQVEAQIHYNLGHRDSTIQDPPASLDWEAWCGPAPKLDYRPSIGHGAWRLEKEYGNGHLVDWGIHFIDIVRKTMNLEMPTSLYSMGGINVFDGMITTPDTLNSTMNFEECPMIWQHRLWGTGDINPQYNNGVFFYGEKATLFAAEHKLYLKPVGKEAQMEVTDIPTPDMQQRHVADFVHALQARDKSLLSCTIEDAFQSTATALLAMISYHTKSHVKWDAEKMSIVENEAAAKLMARLYRGDYKRPVL